MTTLTIILITWFIAGLLSNIIIIYDMKDDIRVGDIKFIIGSLLFGYISLFLVLILLSIEYIKLPKIKLPDNNKIIWKRPKNR